MQKEELEYKMDLMVTMANVVGSTAHKAVRQLRNNYTDNAPPSEEYYYHPRRVGLTVEEFLKMEGAYAYSLDMKPDHETYMDDFIQTLMALRCAPYLHDVIEDTGITHDFLKENFNAATADVVLGLSDVTTPYKGIPPAKGYLSRSVRKAIERCRKYNLPQYRKEVVVIKMADYKDNWFNDCRNDGAFRVQLLIEIIHSAAVFLNTVEDAATKRYIHRLLDEIIADSKTLGVYPSFLLPMEMKERRAWLKGHDLVVDSVIGDNWFMANGTDKTVLEVCEPTIEELLLKYIPVKEPENGFSQ